MQTVRRALGNDDHGTLRLLGGVLFGIGALVLLLRRTSFAEPWGSGAIFLTLAVPAVLLYGAGMVGARTGGRPNAWQATFTVFGLLLIPVTLFAFLDWVGGDTGSSLNGAWILALSAAFAFVAGLRGRVRYCCLIGSLLLVGAWLLLWDSILDGGLAAHIGTLRWLLVISGLLLLGGAAAIAMRQSDDSSDVVTGAGVALVIAGGLAGFAALSAGALVALTPFKSSLFWDLELLVVAAALLAHGAAAGVRGSTYVGALGLVAFIGQVGLDLDDSSPSGAAVGWPLLLLVAGALALAISVAPALRQRD